LWKGGQVGVGQKNAPNASVLFMLNSTTQGFLGAVMTGSQWGAISSKLEGLQSYWNSTHKMVLSG